MGPQLAEIWYLFIQTRWMQNTPTLFQMKDTTQSKIAKKHMEKFSRSFPNISQNNLECTYNDNSRKLLGTRKVSWEIVEAFLLRIYVCDLGMTHLRRFKQNTEGCLSKLITSFMKVFVRTTMRNFALGFLQEIILLYLFKGYTVLKLSLVGN